MKKRPMTASEMAKLSNSSRTTESRVAAGEKFRDRIRQQDPDFYSKIRLGIKTKIRKMPK